MPSSVRVKREEFLKALQSVQPGLSIKELVEQSQCFVFRNGMVLTYNDEVSCRYKSGLDKEFQAAVHAKPLQDLLQKMSEEEIELILEEHELIVKGVKRRAGISMEREILLGLGAVEKPMEWTELPNDFSEAVGIVASCAGDPEAAFSLSCVHFHPNYIEACDNFQLTRYALKFGLQSEFLIRQTSIKHIIALGMTLFSETESWVHFKNSSGLIFSCRRFKEDYPNVGHLLEVEGSKTVLPGGLSEAVDKAQIFLEKGEPRVLVQMSSNGTMTLSAIGAHGWYEEEKGIKYTGKDMAFLIAPKILIDIGKRHNECEIAPDRLKVNGGKFTYISCLQPPPKKGTTRGKEKESEPAATD